jgi:hypothetical protein
MKTASGFQINAGHFFIFFLDLLLTTVAASAMVLFVSASVETFAIANLLTILIFIISMVNSLSTLTRGYCCRSLFHGSNVCNSQMAPQAFRVLSALQLMN